MRFGAHPVTLRQLQYVVAVADKSSFRRAAEVCHVSQPSLSAQLAQAEEALGVRIFERDQRRVALTPEGAELVTRIRRLLAEVDGLIDAAASMTDPLAGALRLGVIPTIAPYLLPEVAPKLREQFPRLTFLWVEEKTATLSERLARAELDGAILALEAPGLAGLPHVVIGKDPFVFASAHNHPLATTKRALDADALEGESVLLLEDGHCFRDQALALCSRSGAVESEFRATSLATLVQMTAGGLAATILPSLAVPIENRHGELHVRPFAPKAPARTLGLVWRASSARGPALEAIGKAVAEGYQGMKRG